MDAVDLSHSPAAACPAGRRDGRLLLVGKLVLDEVVTHPRPVTPGSGQRATAVVRTGGGQVWHTARVLATAGQAVAVTGWCGSDQGARHLRQELVASGVEDRLLATDGPGPHSLVLVGPDGDRAIVSLPARPHFAPCPAQLDALLAGVDWVHLDGHVLADGTAAGVLELAAAAASRGLPLSLEPSNVARIADQARWLAALPGLQVLFGRPDELTAASAHLGVPPQLVVAHDGPSPAHATTTGGRRAAHAVPTDVPVVTTGAGDRFCGGWLSLRHLWAGASTPDADLRRLLATAVDAALRPG